MLDVPKTTTSGARASRRSTCSRRSGEPIVGDAEELGEPVVSNGLSLCSIHHRAFDEDLVGIAADLRVHVSPRQLEDEDGPMLDVLKSFHGTTIEAPSRQLWCRILSASPPASSGSRT
jgi:hypothetical protein